ncbi:DUF885 domain-containing protein [Streptomyces sp. NBC_01092]|uniref:DUF885 domain-containing protein n=1 Tax=Streptomyces sp. NBC_01092 TaxID=2903748 RepID=UPI003864C054
MDTRTELLPRQIADAHLTEYTGLDPVSGVFLGIEGSEVALPDFSPAWQDSLARLARTTLTRLEAAERRPGAADAAERRCGALLRERLHAELALHEASEHLRAVSNMDTPAHNAREMFTLVPTDTEDDWAAVRRLLGDVPAALSGYRESLTLGLEQGLPGGPHATAALVGQLGEWLTDGERGWFHGFVSDAPAASASLRSELDTAAERATEAVATLRDWLRDTYAPAVADAPDTVGRDRYAHWSRYFNGTDLDLDEAYAYGWAEYHRLLGEMRTEAARVLPSAATPWEALAHLDAHGTLLDGPEKARVWLQDLMDGAIETLHGVHFDLDGPLRHVESRIAPAGSAATPYYTGPSEDFSRPGRTWLPAEDGAPIPVHTLVSTWYHEGVPGHHLQTTQWMLNKDRLSRYQATLGWVSANCEGWALYAERLMDELGFLTDPEHRLGHLDAQMMRAMRVIVDIGMHLELPIPREAPFRPGERWTPELASEFMAAHSGRSAGYLRSELVRYLSTPGQAIGYKLGERAWLLGRENARRARPAAFDVKAWHMAALSLGSLGLDDLVTELSAL